MAKIELGKVVDLIIKEDNSGVDALLENWFRQQTKQIHESIMEDDSITDDQDEIENEEFFGSNDLSETLSTDTDIKLTFSVPSADDMTVYNKLLKLFDENDFDYGPYDPETNGRKMTLRFSFEDTYQKTDALDVIDQVMEENGISDFDVETMKAIDENDEEDTDVDINIDQDDTGEASDLDDPSEDTDVDNDIDTFSTDPDVIQDQFADVEDDLARLESEFDEIFGNSSDEETDVDSSYDYETENEIPNDDLDEDVTDSELDHDEDEMFDDLDADEERGPYDDLAEALKLDLVTIPDLDDEDGKEVGSGNDGIKGQNTKSPALQKGIDERMGDAGPVEIKSPDNAKGYPEFPKPDVKDGNGAKGTIRNKYEPLTRVPENGDNSAILNKSQGKQNDKSILGDGNDTRSETIRKIERRSK